MSAPERPTEHEVLKWLGYGIAMLALVVSFLRDWTW